MKQFFGSKSRRALTTVLIVSLALHIVAVVIFGMIKFVSELREEKVFEAAPVEITPQEEQEYEVNIPQRNQSAPPPRPPTIVVNNPSDMDIPTLDIDVNIEGSNVYGRSTGGFGKGTDGLRDMAISGSLFGKQVEAKNLGVILDVSYSTHDILSPVIDEIQSSFPNAMIVFAPGCSIDDSRDNQVVRIVDYQRTAKRYQQRYGGGNLVTKNFIDTLLRRQDFKKIWERTNNRGKGYVLFSEIKGGKALGGSEVAMEFLADRGADVIYWFADFDDIIFENLAKRTAEDLKRKWVKLIIHDFKPPLASVRTRPRLKMMARETGGEFFLKPYRK